MVVSVYFLDTAPVVMDFQDYDVEMVRTKDCSGYADVCMGSAVYTDQLGVHCMILS